MYQKMISTHEQHGFGGWGLQIMTTQCLAQYPTQSWDIGTGNYSNQHRSHNDYCHSCNRLFNICSFFFPFIFISWRLITLQHCSGFCHTLTWISRGFTCVPHPETIKRALPFETATEKEYLALVRERPTLVNWVGKARPADFVLCALCVLVL